MNLSYDEFRVLADEANQLDWLNRAISRAELVRLTEDQLLARTADMRDASRQELLKELQIRLSHGEQPRELEKKLADQLANLHDQFQDPGRDSQAVDRMLDRFLHRLPSDQAADLALMCAQSHRLGRRRAAWHFYRIHGHDAASRSVFAACFPAGGRWEFLRSICDDAPLICAVGVGRLLDQAQEFYWRGRALATVLRSDSAIFQAAAGARAEEALFAIYLERARSESALAKQLLEANARNPGVCATAIRIFGTFGAAEELNLAIQYGERVLRQTTNRFYLGMPTDALA